MARRRCACCLLLCARGDFPLGDYRPQADTTDHIADIKCEYGGHRVHYQFAASAVREHAFVAGWVGAAAMATPGAHRAGAVLWDIFDVVALERSVLNYCICNS